MATKARRPTKPPGGDAKRYRVGTHRGVAPAVTLRRYLPVARTLGMTRLAELTDLDDLAVPVVSAIRPNSKSLATQQGKGQTLVAARASAMMECIETWHAENVALPTEQASARALARRGRVIDVARLPRQRAVSQATSLAWVLGRCLIADAPCWVPREAVSLDCTFAADAPPIFDVSSNGLASGNSHDEAVVHALCEVIERDAEARWRRAGDDRRVVLDTICAPGTRRLLERLRRRGCRVGVWELTSDVGVPVFGAMLLEDPAEPSWRGLGVYQGFGCHLDPEIAVSRALTEAVQTRLTYIAGSRDDFFPSDYAHASDPDAAERAWGLLTSPPDESVDLRAGESLTTPTFAGDVAALIQALRDAGAQQVVVVDLARPELGVPVVKVLVPGRANDLAWMG
jgi:YcaO-like protein with predicted kinase domain